MVFVSILRLISANMVFEKFVVVVAVAYVSREGVYDCGVCKDQGAAGCDRLIDCRKEVTVSANAVLYCVACFSEAVVMHQMRISHPV